ncbi:MAG: tRNA lysidine(34) synthetase TilS [Myxococcota bacterium]
MAGEAAPVPAPRKARQALLGEVQRSLRALDLSGRRLLVAASGGVDSTVLSHAVHALSRLEDLELGLGHVHHGLRGAESDADADCVQALARKLDIPFLQRRIDPTRAREGHSSRLRPTLQEAGRALRYAALEEMAQSFGAEAILTAHHADDQAETVMLRLLRGAGPDALGGIPERTPDGRVARPLLRVPREDLERYARAVGLSWREDRSNRSPAYSRNRLRGDWLPGLAEAFNPRLLRSLSDLAEAQRRDSEWLGALVDAEAAQRFVAEGRGLKIDVRGFGELPEALARRLAREALRRCGAGRDVSRAHLERMLAFLREPRAGRNVEFPRGLRLSKCHARECLLAPVAEELIEGLSPPGTC